eukprot:1160878-Pelagomonas_calceolata.AAC.10
MCSGYGRSSLAREGPFLPKALEGPPKALEVHCLPGRKTTAFSTSSMLLHRTSSMLVLASYQQHAGPSIMCMRRIWRAPPTPLLIKDIDGTPDWDARAPGFCTTSLDFIVRNLLGGVCTTSLRASRVEKGQEGEPCITCTARGARGQAPFQRWGFGQTKAFLHYPQSTRVYKYFTYILYASMRQMI